MSYYEKINLSRKYTKKQNKFVCKYMGKKINAWADYDWDEYEDEDGNDICNECGEKYYGYGPCGCYWGPDQSEMGNQ